MSGTDDAALTGLRERLHTGAPLLGTFVIVPRVEVVEAVALAGFDLVVLDLEHGPLTVETLPSLVAAAHGAALHVLVRVGHRTAQDIGSVLDVGSDGVIVPHVDSGAEARAAVSAARFPPQGERSIHYGVRAGHYGGRPDYLTHSNASVAVLTMVESAAGLANLDDVLATDGLDGIFVGPLDLAASLGTDPAAQDGQGPLADVVRDVLVRAGAHGKAASLFSPDPGGARGWLDEGMRMVVLSIDTLLMAKGFATAQAAARPDVAPPADEPMSTHRRTENHV